MTDMAGAAVPDIDTTDLAKLTVDELAALDAWWQASNYLTVGQIYLQENLPTMASGAPPRVGHRRAILAALVVTRLKVRP